MHDTFAIDLFTVPTATFTVLYVCVIMLHKRREVIHFNVAAHPTAQWTGQQIVEACPWGITPKYLVRDRDGVYGTVCRKESRIWASTKSEQRRKAHGKIPTWRGSWEVFAGIASIT